jgi:hypothetical protein
MCSETSGIVGPNSFGDIVTADHHIHVLQEELLPFLEGISLSLREKNSVLRC